MTTLTFDENLLKHILQNAAIANVGDAGGLQPSAAAGSLYISLHTADPGKAGSQTTNEAAYTGYARQAVARSGAGWAVTSGATPAVGDNVNPIAFPLCTGGSESEMFFGVGSAVSGAGTLFMSGPLGSFKGPFVGEDSNDQITLKGHGLVVDDRIAFFARPGETLPTGITQGTVYFVKTVPDVDNVTIASTSGGATINITADGGGAAFKVVPLAVSNGITPSFAAGVLDLLVG